MVSYRVSSKLYKLLVFSAIVWLLIVLRFELSAFPDEEKEVQKPKDINDVQMKQLLEDHPEILVNVIREQDKHDYKAKNEEDKLRENMVIKPNDLHKAALIHPPNSHDGPGEMGQPVHIDVQKLSQEDKIKHKKGQENFAFNNYVSDLISLHRMLPDFRDEKCKEPGRYPNDLPASSVILCFHDESWSALLRSVHSILDRTPEHLLTELILVDDYSSFENLKQPLEGYLKQYAKVKLIRTTKREGLVRARILGANAAKGPVLTFLDSHIECTQGWLEPLVATIYSHPTAAVVPVIEIIDQETMALRPTACADNSVGGFDWSLTFDWHTVPKRISEKLTHPCDPLPSPTMAGGLFSIAKDFFERLGYYDQHLDVWGGENLELSFKVWMCGGELYQIPCSHVGHIFRSRNPYAAQSSLEFGNFVRKNTLRVAEVWLDEYKDVFYAQGSPIKASDAIGDLSEAIKKRKELKCHSFDWYINNIYPEIYMPLKNPAYGEVRNHGDQEIQMCLDAITNQLYKAVGVYSCHKMGGNQFWSLTKEGQLRNFRGCLDYSGSGEVILYSCHGVGGNQIWIFRVQNRQIYHKVSKKCLTVDRSNLPNAKLTVAECNPVHSSNQWSLTKMQEAELQQMENELM